MAPRSRRRAWCVALVLFLACIVAVWLHAWWYSHMQPAAYQLHDAILETWAAHRQPATAFDDTAWALSQQRHPASFAVGAACPHIRVHSPMVVDLKLTCRQCGFGNFLFQLAAAVGLAAAAGVPVRVAIEASDRAFVDQFASGLELPGTLLPVSVWVTSQAGVAQDKQRSLVLDERFQWGRFHPDLLCPAHERGPRPPVSSTSHVFLHGFFQSFKYFHAVRARLHTLLAVRPALEAGGRAALQRLRAAYPGRPVVAVIVRRGELATVKAAWRLYEHYWVPDEKWLRSAARYVRGFYRRRPGAPRPLFAFVTVAFGAQHAADVAWLRRVAASIPDASVLSGVVFLDAWYVVRHADSVIATAGSFAWWGAYLNDHVRHSGDTREHDASDGEKGLVVACRDFMGATAARLAATYRPADYFPPAWHLFDRGFRRVAAE